MICPICGEKANTLRVSLHIIENVMLQADIDFERELEVKPTQERRTNSLLDFRVMCLTCKSDLTYLCKDTAIKDITLQILDKEVNNK